MSNSSPADLAVAFRSLPRRLDNASADAPPAAVIAARAGVEDSISKTARLLGVAVSASAVADAIVQRRVDDWSDDELQQIQTHADAAGRAIRVLSDAAEATRD
jgi:hypothetical protein